MRNDVQFYNIEKKLDNLIKAKFSFTNVNEFYLKKSEIIDTICHITNKLYNENTGDFGIDLVFNNSKITDYQLILYYYVNKDKFYSLMNWVVDNYGIDVNYYDAIKVKRVYKLQSLDF